MSLEDFPWSYSSWTRLLVSSPCALSVAVPFCRASLSKVGSYCSVQYRDTDLAMLRREESGNGSNPLVPQSSMMSSLSSRRCPITQSCSTIG